MIKFVIAFCPRCRRIRIFSVLDLWFKEEFKCLLCSFTATRDARTGEWSVEEEMAL